jgi:ubiquinone/menaquinone biosynthesis C-methylase UbiE
MSDHASSDKPARNLETWERLRETFDTIAREGSVALMRENHMHLGLAITNELPAMEKDTVLDLSCGDGWFTRHLAVNTLPDGQVIGVDLSPAMIEQAAGDSENPANVRFETASAENLPFEDASIDHIVSIESFYYYPDQVLVGHEMFRVLKPGGTFFMAMHYYLENEWSHSWSDLMDVPMHCKGADQYNTLFRACGFIDVGDQRIRDESELPDKVDGKWFRSVEQLRQFRETGALLVSGRRPPEEE